MLNYRINCVDKQFDKAEGKPGSRKFLIEIFSNTKNEIRYYLEFTFVKKEPKMFFISA